MTGTTDDYPITSELNEAFMARFKLLTAISALGACFFSWGMYETVFGREREPLWVTLALGALALALISAVVYSMYALRQAPCRSLVFDTEGLWLASLGKERGLVRYRDIHGTAEDSSMGRLTLFGKEGKVLLKVEYDRTHYRELRNLISDGMAFQPPALPATISPSLDGIILVASISGAIAISGWFMLTDGGLPILGLLFTALGVAMFMLSVLTRRRLKLTIDHKGLRNSRRAVSYSQITSVSIVDQTIGGQAFPCVVLAVTDGPPFDLAYLGGNSVTLRRTILWALEAYQRAVRPPDDAAK